MKSKHLFIMALFALLPATLKAQTTDTRFAGVWQQTQRITGKDGNQRLAYLPVWKVNGNDNTFFTFLIATPDGVSVKTNEGTYTVLNDSTLEEHVSGSITTPALVGKSNTIHYRFSSPDVLRLRFRMPGREHDVHEVWTRVRLAIPGQ